MRIRAIGLAVFAALALSAFPAGASASGGFVADEYPVSLSGETTWGIKVEFVGMSPECDLDFETSIEAPSSQLSTGAITPQCGGNSMKMNGCQLEFNPGSSSFDIGPPGCGPITASLLGCNMSIAAQTGLPATYTNAGSGSEAEARISISAIFQYSHGEQPVSCGKKAGTHSGQLRGEWSVSGSNGEEAPVGVRSVTSGGLPVGTFISEPHVTPLLDAQIFPVNFGGEQTTDAFGHKEFTVLVAAGQAARCTTATFADFNGEASAARYGLAFNADFDGCKYAGTNITVDMNSCFYRFEGLSYSAPSLYKSSWRIDCVTGGDKIELDMPGIKCIMKIPAQTLNNTQELENTGLGSEAAVEARVSSNKAQIEAENYPGSQGLICQSIVLSKTPAGSIFGAIKLGATYAG